MTAWYKASIWLGILPLFIGISIYLTWLKTRAEFLELAGFYNILFGLISVLIAFVCLIVFIMKNRKLGNSYPVVKLLIAFLVIFVNFPAAIAIIGAVQYENSTYHIVITNHSRHSIHDFIILEGDKEYLIGDVDPQDTLNKTIHFWHEGSVTYKFNLDGEEYSGILFGYVSSGLSFSADINITEDKKVEIKDHITSG